MPKQFTLSKKERLKSRKLIEQLFSSGRRFSISPFRILYQLTPPDALQSPLQAGVSVSSRNFKKAVDRNRIKRLIREAYRLQKPALQQLLKDKNLGLVIFLIYTGKELPAYKLVYERIKLILTDLEKMIHENSPANT